jgi:hypothetical protein
LGELVLLGVVVGLGVEVWLGGAAGVVWVVVGDVLGDGEPDGDGEADGAIFEYLPSHGSQYGMTAGVAKSGM